MQPSVYPPSYRGYHGTKKFLREGDAQFEDCNATSYRGFVRESAAELPSELHDSFRESLNALDVGGVFQYDITQPMGPGSPCGITKVTRTCIGQPGITYKYLGLRMFAHPWTDDTVVKDSDSDDLQRAYASFRRQNEALTIRSERFLKLQGKGGSADFSLTLINRMENTATIRTLKEEPDFGMGKVSVSWHADSSLVHESTIAVYCVHRDDDGKFPLKIGEEPQKKSKKSKKKRKLEQTSEVPAARSAKPGQWQVALRVVHDIEGPNSKANNDISQATGRKRDFRVTGDDGVRHSTLDDEVTPPIVVDTSDGDAYYMLGDFNHHHQHAVLAGDSCVRYTSTHRVGLEEGHSFYSIKARCEAALSKAAQTTSTSTAAAPSGPQWHEEALAAGELEFEWLRQFYVQGAKHKRLHRWWHGPMEELLALWRKMNALLLQRIATLQAAAAGGADALLRLSNGGTSSGGGTSVVNVLDATVVVLGDLGRRHR